MLPSWISGLFAKTVKTSRRQRRAARPSTHPRFRPRLEALEDRTLLSATLPISVDPAGTTMGNGPSSTTASSVSANGQYEVFISSATDLVNGVAIQGFSGNHVYLRNLSTGATRLVDVATDGTESGHNSANYASISSDGRYVAFISNSNDLTNNDANVSAAQVYVRDMQTGQTYLVSLGTDGKPENATGYLSQSTPSIVEDGNGQLLIAYQSRATNLTSGDINGKQYQIFLARLDLDSSGNIQYGSLQTTLVSADPNGNGAGTGIGKGGDSWDPMLSKDGSTLSFRSYATNLNVPGGYNDNNPYIANLYLYSLANQTLQLLSAEPTTGTNATGNASSALPQDIAGVSTAYQESMSADGQYVVFTSSSDNLVPGVPTYGDTNVYRRDVVHGTTSLVSINDSGTAGVNFGDIAQLPVITPDGRYVAFTADGTALTSNNNSGGTQVYVRDMQQGKTYLVTLGIDGKPSNSVAWIESIAETSNGQLVIAYRSNATNLTANDTSTHNQIFVTTLGLDSNGYIEYNTLATKLVSADINGNGGNDNSDDAILSKDGSTLAFESKATNLAGETPDNADGYDHLQVFVYKIASGTLTQASPAPPSGDVADSSWLSSISDNGQYLTFDYQIPNTDIVPKVLAWDANTGKTTVVFAEQVFINQPPTAYVLGATLISGDGSTIAFNVSDVYGHGLIYTTGDWGFTLKQISFDIGSQVNGQTVYSATQPNISENGKVVVYTLQYTFAKDQVFAGRTEISQSYDTGNSNGSSDRPEVNSDGSTIAYNSTSSNIDPGLNFIVGQDNVFAFNTAAAVNVNSLVSAKAPGVFTTDADILSPSLSDNGRYVAYYTGANDLLTNLPIGPGSVFAEDVQKGVPTIIASNSYAHIYSTVLSGDGSTVAFTDDAQLTNIKTNGEQIYAASNWQSSTPTITLVSINSTGDGGGNGNTENPSISDNGQIVAFDSKANNLTANDPNAKGYTQIFVRDLKTNTTALASANSSGSDGGDNSSDTPVVSSDGSTVIYDSSATDLVSGVTVSTDSNSNPIVPNVYAYLSNTSTPILISNPRNQTVTVGQTATFTATSSGTPAPVVQWKVSTDGGKTFTNISGATSTTLTLTNVTAAMNGNEYQAVFSNIFGTANTSAAALTVSPPPPSAPPPAQLPPPVLQTPPLLTFFNSLLGGVETINGNDTETLTDSFLGIPLLVSTFDSHGNLVSVDLFGTINITLLFL